MKQFVTEKEVSKITGIALQTLRNWRHKNRGFAYSKVGRSIRYDVDDVLAFMDSLKIHTQDSGGHAGRKSSVHYH